MTENDIFEAVDWKTRNERKSYGVPTNSFWEFWRSDKEGVKELGFRAYPGNCGWEVSFNGCAPGAATPEPWQDEPAFEDAAPRSIEPAPETPSAGIVDPQFLANPLPPVANLNPASENYIDELIAQVFPGLASRQWSDEQRAIFQWFRLGKGNLVVSARAGTGKTTTIKVAFAFAPEGRMVYLVFNKKNQREAEREISDARVQVMTLHKAGLRVIRTVWSKATPDDRVEDARINRAAQKFSVNGIRIALPDEVFTAVKQLVGFAKNCYINPSEAQLLDLIDARDLAVESPEWRPGKLAAMAAAVLELSKIRDAENRISFNDMVWLPVAMNWVRATYDVVVVDEAQDMNLPQLTMARQLVKQGGRCIVVGDDRQCIYQFRGAVANALQMMAEALNAEVKTLTTTYRCPKVVVQLANAMVPDYYAAPTAPEGLITDLGSSQQLIKTFVPGDAVLGRKNAPLMPLCLSFLKNGISARIEGRDIGKALAAIARKFKAGSVPEFIERLNNWRKKQLVRAQASEYADDKVALINDQHGTLLAVAEDADSVEDVLTKLTNLFQDSDGQQKPAVVFSSVHKAKGLEWNRVALLMETFRVTSGEGDEANIFYVAVTRAKQELVRVAAPPK